MTGGYLLAFKIFRKNCCGLDVHKTWIFACIGITDANGRTEYFEKRFSSFSRGLHELDDWLTLYQKLKDDQPKLTVKTGIYGPAENLLEFRKSQIEKKIAFLHEVMKAFL